MDTDDFHNPEETGLPGDTAEPGGVDDAENQGWVDIGDTAGGGEDDDVGGQEETSPDEPQGNIEEPDTERGGGSVGDTSRDAGDGLESSGSEGVEEQGEEEEQQETVESVTQSDFQEAMQAVNEKLDVGNSTSLVLCIAMFAVLGSQVFQTVFRRLERA